MGEVLQLDAPTLDAIADRVVTRLQAAQSAPRAVVVDVEGAMRMTGHNSLAAFYRWKKKHRVRPLEQGRYSVRRLEVALGTGGSR